MTKQHQCQNCYTEVESIELLPIERLEDRVFTGEIMPSGECPNCGALCHPIDKSIPNRFELRSDDDAYARFYIDGEKRENSELDDAYADRINKALRFLETMSRFTTPKQEFCDADLHHNNTYGDVEEMIENMSDERLWGEYRTFMTMVSEAQQIMKGVK